MVDPTRAAVSPVPLQRRLVDPVTRRPEEAKADALADGLWCLRLPLPYPATRTVNAFLLAGAEGWTLVDCGSGVGAGWEALVHALGLAGVEPRAVTTLVLTHLHCDHASLASEVAERIGCRVMRHAGPDTNSDRLRDLQRPLAWRRADARAQGVPAAALDGMVDTPLAGDGRQPRPRIDYTLADGEVLRTRAGDWRVVSVTGHSPQQMALFDARRGLLIAADTAYAGIRPYLEWGHSPDPFAEYLASLDRADALGASLVLPGHGRPDDAPGERFAAAREAIAGVAATVLAEVGHEPRSPYEITCALVGQDPDPDARGSWLSVALCVLDHLERRGELTCETASDGVRRFAVA